MKLSRQFFSRTRWMSALILLCALLTSGMNLLAQDGPQRGGGPRRPDHDGERPRPDSFPPFADPNLGFIASEMRWGGKPVKGAPYSAQVTTEHNQTLSNGTHISYQSATSIYRDSEGRTRQEETVTAFGSVTASSESPRMIFINDPVAGVQYVLNPRDHTASKMSAPAGRQFPAQPLRAERRTEQSGTDASGKQERSKESFGKQESLGKQMIEGIEAEGQRFTFTIPIGQIGNDRPIEVVSERWYSPALQVVVLSKHNDPRFGETVTRLTNINRSEPARTLFEVPADYRLRSNEAHREPNPNWRK